MNFWMTANYYLRSFYTIVNYGAQLCTRWHNYVHDGRSTMVCNYVHDGITMYTMVNYGVQVRKLAVSFAEEVGNWIFRWKHCHHSYHYHKILNRGYFLLPKK